VVRDIKTAILSQIFTKFATIIGKIMAESIEIQILGRIKKAGRGVLFLPTALWLMAMPKP